MSMFGYGDVVKLTAFQSNFEYYIVTDLDTGDSKKDDKDTLYEIMKIYPVERVSKVAYIAQKDITLVAQTETSDCFTVMYFVNAERRKKGITAKPDYVRAIERNTQPVKKGGVKVKVDDVVRYDKLATIDECLDALNDLDGMHRLFGDDAYLQLKDVVLERLKTLV